MLENFMEHYFKIEKAYRKYFQAEMEEYQITPNEILVLLFLCRNDSSANTAKDIAQNVGVSKGLIARSVEHLAGRGYLRAERDAADRRVVHTYLTDAAGGPAEKIFLRHESFIARLGQGIPEEKLRVTMQTIRNFVENISSADF